MLTRYRGWGDIGFSELARQYGSFDQMARHLEAQLGDRTPPAVGSAPRPGYRMRVREHDDRFVLSAEVPGFTEGDFDLQVTADFVSIKGRRALTMPEGFRAARRERDSAELDHRFRLATPIAVDQVSASLDKGILTVTLPKAPEAKPRRIAIQTG